MTPSRTKEIERFLDESNAQLLTSTTTRAGGKLSIYAVNGKPFIVQLFEEGEGWEAFIPADGGQNSTEKTLLALGAYIQP